MDSTETFEDGDYAGDPAADPKWMRGVAVVSGGMDSTVLLYDGLDEGVEFVQAVSFNYGQRHKKELEFARQTCEALHIPWSAIDLWGSGLMELLSKSESSLISNNDVPEGHYAADNMKQTVVPNRNMIMLAMAGGVAVALDATFIATGVHAGDHFIYPDCRPRFIQPLAAALSYGNEGFGAFPEVPQGELPPSSIITPFINSSKADIAARGIELDVDFSKTWSCYKGGEIHCGKCGTCVERLEALDEAAKRMGLRREDIDTTEYADTEFWKSALANAGGE